MVFRRRKKNTPATAPSPQPATPGSADMGAATQHVDPLMRAAALLDPLVSVGPDLPRPPVLFDIVIENYAVWSAFRDAEVQAANAYIADGLDRGEHSDLPPIMATWFREHRDQPVSPLRWGWLWYPGQRTKVMQLIDARMYIVDSNPFVGSHLWGSRAMMSDWELTAIDVGVDDDGTASWRAPDGFPDIVATAANGRPAVLDLSVGRALGEDHLTREFLMGVEGMLQSLDGVIHQGSAIDLETTAWPVSSTGASTSDLVRAVVVALYAMEERLPVSFGPMLPSEVRDLDDPAAIETPSGASPDPELVTAESLLTVTEADLAYAHTVKFANQAMANKVAAGQAADMQPEMQAWFVEHAGEPTNPTEAFGLTWYLGPETGNVQLVAHEILVATGMEKPENQPGTLTWAIA